MDFQATELQTTESTTTKPPTTELRTTLPTSELQITGSPTTKPPTTTAFPTTESTEIQAIQTGLPTVTLPATHGHNDQQSTLYPLQPGMVLYPQRLSNIPTGQQVYIVSTLQPNNNQISTAMESREPIVFKPSQQAEGCSSENVDIRSPQHQQLQSTFTIRLIVALSKYFFV